LVVFESTGAGDSTPSFHIKIGDQLWFGASASTMAANIFGYLQRLWGCDFKMALKPQGQGNSACSTSGLTRIGVVFCAFGT
jgi:hypothetical protein